MVIENQKGGNLELLDGRGKHNNGWFVVRSLVPSGASANAIEWLVTPHAIEGWKSEPVIQISQVGYHPKQQKVAVIELDKNDAVQQTVSLMRLSEKGGMETALESAPKEWGKFLRYHYVQLDFTKVEKPGMYVVKYGKYQSAPFKIGEDVFKRHVWQPTLEYFLPVQMCHMRVNERYRLWHGWCHLDDARMAPTDLNHFDGYLQGPTTMTKYRSGEVVPGINIGGWHDAGDFDMRIESQAETVQGLALAYEEFGEKYDNTRIDQKTKVVDIQVPDGKSDILQQAEHGLLTIVGGYKSLGRLYRGIIEPTLQQYVHLGDAQGMTDNVFFTKDEKNAPAVGLPGSPDDRWVFTEDNPRRELDAIAALAAGARVMKGHNDTLATQSLQIAEELWNINKDNNHPMWRVDAAVELLITTKNKKYADFLVSNADEIAKNIEQKGYMVGRVLNQINNKKFTATIKNAVKGFAEKVAEMEKKTPYGVPYEPSIWGAGWGIQNFGFRQYFLHTRFPDIFPNTYMFHAMNFVLGCHPGSNTASFASGVGSVSATTGYGLNRADWSYIPGGIISGTALIRPDFPELLTWPYLWQQTEYVLGGGTTDYLFLVLAADHLLSQTK
jgi:endoglucanase